MTFCMWALGFVWGQDRIEQSKYNSSAPIWRTKWQAAWREIARRNAMPPHAADATTTQIQHKPLRLRGSHSSTNHKRRG
jgi:hypothetical protein